MPAFAGMTGRGGIFRSLLRVASGLREAWASRFSEGEPEDVWLSGVAAGNLGRHAARCHRSFMQNAPIDLRPMQSRDAPAVATLIRAAFTAQPVMLNPPASALGVMTETVAAHLARAGGAVAEADGRLLGSVLWEEQDGGLYVSRVAVTPFARRQGIARMLIAAADNVARRQGLRYLSLGTRLALAGNRRLFAGCGFVEIALHAHPGYDTPTWVEMRKWVVWE